jgi:starvation-inducible DNA-binding protein
MATKTMTNKETREGAQRMRTVLVRTRNSLPEETRKQMIELLNQLLADTFDLFTQTKQAHWNVKGPQFFQLHELYDDLAEKLLGHVDVIAERATALGGAATGTARMAARSTRLPEYKDTFVGSRESVELLVERFAAVANATREGIDESEKAEDMITTDLLTQVGHELDKSLWFLESHIQKTD